MKNQNHIIIYLSFVFLVTVLPATSEAQSLSAKQKKLKKDIELIKKQNRQHALKNKQQEKFAKQKEQEQKMNSQIQQIKAQNFNSIQNAEESIQSAAPSDVFYDSKCERSDSAQFESSSSGDSATYEKMPTIEHAAYEEAQPYKKRSTSSVKSTKISIYSKPSKGVE